MFSSLKNKELPPFSAYRKALFSSLLFIVLPNFFFLFAAWQLGVSRPLFNLDYLLVATLIIIPLRFFKALGCIAFIVVSLIDMAMLMMQIFPFMDMAATIYFLPFIFTAPTRYLLLLGIVIIYLFLMPCVLWKMTHQLSKWWVVFWLVLMGSCGYQLRYAVYKDVSAEQFFGRTNYFVMKSQISLYLEHHNHDFILQTRITPQLQKRQTDHATQYFQQPYTQKILLIVAESWGTAREDAVDKAILEKIYQKKHNLEFLKTGRFDFSGATVQGELRELCQLAVANGYAFRKVPDHEFSDCLPRKLQQKGWQTFAIHGASSQLYDRQYLYPKLGFQHTYFSENMLDKERCTAFNGVCDKALFDTVGHIFAQNQKAFVYWLTLTSHSSYPKKDIFNHRLNCDKYGLHSGDICNNMMMHAQFFDDLAALIDKPEMQGVEVVVVGDHMPPIMGNVPLHQNLRWEMVNWLHFKVK